MFIDSHCHLDRLKLDSYQNDLGLALQSARDSGVHQFLTISVDLDDTPVLATLCTQYQDIKMSVGVHPCEDLTMFARVSVDHLCELAQPDYVWAIGETGLDYHYSKELEQAQKHSFVQHIHASQRLHKPLIVHTREARQDTLDILKAEQATQGILHCFTEDWDTAKQALDLGFYVSFSGIVSFKNAQQIRDVVAQMPRDRILIETDSPYLAPAPYRGKSNEPSYLPYVAQAIGDVLSLSPEAVGALTTENFNRLFAEQLKLSSVV